MKTQVHYFDILVVLSILQGAYGRDINTNISILLQELTKVLPEDVMLRIGMTNPPYMMEHLENIAKILNHPNVYSFLHVPVQVLFKINTHNLVVG